MMGELAILLPQHASHEYATLSTQHSVRQRYTQPTRKLLSDVSLYHDFPHRLIHLFFSILKGDDICQRAAHV